MVGVQATTRVTSEDGEALLVPAEVTEAIALIDSESPLITSEGFSALSHATFNHPIGKEAAGSMGAIRAISEAMQRNLENGTLQEDGCHALRNVAFHCEPNLTLVREEGAIVAVLKAMEKHPANEALQAEGCWALLVFCSNHDQNTAIAKNSAAIVDKAIETYPNNTDIQSKGKFIQALFA